ncbi:flagellar biosynthesis protein FlgK [Methylobacterium sp. Leaf111]|uniref:flagellar hook-associated protein FlgK n=1 Tax=unclassified Methylobacterium TaxID=2615210 RepID=UPI0007022586|nr:MULTISPECIES: flagellar hook-associated protein FlgK [unclassified Methylobacterium]KQP68766.1 flagellar biosynthesis protein FlgK [Methylobacterium sp. Leaf111]KQU26361.1 flagellar biosynthesis protein FlgK [Methylobacterium sp. Leaf94]
MSFNAINTASAGLKATQAAIGVVSQNIANVGTVGYTKRTLDTVSTGVGNSGVSVGTIGRALDAASLRQLRMETSGAAYTGSLSAVRTQLDQLYGTPGASTALDGVMNDFAQSLQALASDPTSAPARATVVTKAANLASTIGTIAQGVQDLRSATESQLGSDTAKASAYLASIAKLNTQITGTTDEGARASLLDQRDQAVTGLSAFLDIQTVDQRDGTLTVITTSGMTLVDRGAAAILSFDGRGTLSPDSEYTDNAATRGVGTITATTPGGSKIDLIATQAIRSGSLAAGIELRDSVLPQAQRQLDELAAGLSRSLSDRSAVGTPPTDGTTGALDIDLAGLKAGNAVTVSVRDAAGTQRNLVLLPYTSDSEPKIDRADINDPTASILPIKLTGTNAGLRDAIQTALGASFSVTSQPSAGTGGLRILTDPSSGAPTLLGVSASVTQLKDPNDFQSGAAQIPLFVDGNKKGTLYTGSFDGGSQLTGFAQRISVNQAVVSNTANLVTLSSKTLASDASRPQYLYQALTGASRTFAAASGIGGVAAPYTASVQDFAQRIIDAQGAGAASAQDLDEGQGIALATAQSRVASVSGVSIDEEMSKLVQLQTAYSANARVLTAARDLLDTLLRI